MAGEALKKLEIRSLLDLHNWLSIHHETSGSLWLVTFKKGSPHHVPYTEVVDELLCFGWVDSLPRKLDADHSMLLIAPRKPKSNWSKINKDKATRLIAEGRMQAAGLALIEAAKAGGQWTALDAIEALAIPADLDVQLRLHQDARRHFDGFPKSAKRGILEWIAAAKTAETRARRIAETARLAQDNIRANQWRKPKT
ncbi:MAG: YdeI/OmpD-associated family protein [Rhizobiaceae bacterium]